MVKGPKISKFISPGAPRQRTNLWLATTGSVENRDRPLTVPTRESQRRVAASKGPASEEARDRERRVIHHGRFVAGSREIRESHLRIEAASTRIGVVSVPLAEAGSEKAAIVRLVVAISEKVVIVRQVAADSEREAIVLRGQALAGLLDRGQSVPVIFQARPVKTGENVLTIAIGVRASAVSPGPLKRDPVLDVHSDRDQNAQAIFQARLVKTGENVPTIVGKMIAVIPGLSKRDRVLVVPLDRGQNAQAIFQARRVKTVANVPTGVGMVIVVGQANAVSPSLLKNPPTGSARVEQAQGVHLDQDQNAQVIFQVRRVKTGENGLMMRGIAASRPAGVMRVESHAVGLDNQKIALRGSARRKRQSVMARSA